MVKVYVETTIRYTAFGFNGLTSRCEVRVHVTKRTLPRREVGAQQAYVHEGAPPTRTWTETRRRLATEVETVAQARLYAKAYLL